MRFVTEGGDDRQDPLIARLGTLIEPVRDRFEEARHARSWSRENRFIRGLELRAGVDVVEDESQQKLALTDRLWCRRCSTKSTAPWFQLSYDIGPLTLSGGFAAGRRVSRSIPTPPRISAIAWWSRAVPLHYKENLPNFGAIWRLPQELLGVSPHTARVQPAQRRHPLRNVNIPNQSVAGISTCRRSSSTTRKWASMAHQTRPLPRFVLPSGRTSAWRWRSIR